MLSVTHTHTHTHAHTCVHTYTLTHEKHARDYCMHTGMHADGTMTGRDRGI